VASAATVPYARRVLRLLRARAPSIAVFLVIVVLFEMLRAWSLGHTSDATSVIIPLWVMTTAPVVPVLVEATGLRGIALAVAMTVATIAALGIAVLALGVLHPGPLGIGVSSGRILSNDAFLYRGWWLYSAASLLFAAYCRAREREQETLRAAREAELARADTQREIVASRLKVLQARVEPALLFDALADVRATYVTDPAAADALLDDLVTYLRAALPHMRGGASTVAREVALADAYLRVVPAGRDKSLVSECNVAGDVADVDFPPMVLLPLVHAAADAGCAQVAIEAMQERGRIAIAIRVAARVVPAGWDEGPLHVVRETLAHYLGSDALLTVTHEHASAVATVAWTSGVVLHPLAHRVA
jgi:Histidine kinase